MKVASADRQGATPASSSEAHDANASPTRVGVLGLGAMGFGIAANLVRGGFNVVGTDPDGDARATAAAEGVTIHESPASLVGADPIAVVVVVRSFDQVRSALFGGGSLTDGARKLAPGTPVVIASTITPTQMVEVANELALHGLHGVGAGLSGGPWGARAGTLTWVVSGPPEAVSTIRPMLEATGIEIQVLAGDVRLAHAAKLAVQAIYGVNMFGVFEALRLCQAYGVSPDDAMQLFTHSVASSWIAENWDHVREWWQGGGNGLDILVKDMRGVQDEAHMQSVSMPVTSLAFELLREVWPAYGHEFPAPDGPAPVPAPWGTREVGNEGDRP